MAQRVENKDRRFGSADTYIHINDDGVDLLFTEMTYDAAKQRALANKEDLPAQGGMFRKVLSLIITAASIGLLLYLMF
jgi:hypothetical protein